MSRRWIGFALYGAVSVIHIVALALDAETVAGPTKLLLMPLLAVAVLWSMRGNVRGLAPILLLAAIALSWIGDGAGAFFPGGPTVPLMLLFFGLAHVAYIWLFWRVIPQRRVPVWTLVYALWWGALLAVLWLHLGALLIPVALYGLVLAGTAIGAARCHPLVLWGGVFFLASDSILAFRLFMPDAMPDFTSPLVMLTYCLGQGLIAAGVVASLPRRGAASARRVEEVAR